MSRRILVSWIGHTDLRAFAREDASADRSAIEKIAGVREGETGSGPVKALIDVETFDEVHLLSDYWVLEKLLLPVAYSGLPSRSWERFARLILEAAYEVTFAAAVLNSSKTGNKSLYLTLLGGGAFGNDQVWIVDAIRRAAKLYSRFDLDVKIVSFRNSNPSIRKLCEELLW